MFGQNKPFGTGFGSSFGSPTTSTFGQTSTSGFGSTPAFGSTGSVFGTQGTTAAPATGNVFGGTSAFGQTNTGFGGFGTTTTTSSGGLFGGTSTFGATPFGGTTTTSSLFGTTQNQPKPFGGGGFGGSSATGSGLFGTTSTQPAGGLFGQSKPAGSSLFGTSATSGTFTSPTGQGSYIKFQPTNTGVDTMIKNGVSSQVNTRHQTITLMKEYDGKSIEEIRMEDYMLGRNKGPQNRLQGGFGSTFGSPTSSTPLFGATGATGTTGGMFGQQQAKPMFGGALGSTTSTSGGGLFGQQAQSTTSGGSLFGTQSKPAFGATTTGATFGFGQQQPAASGGLFGSTQAKPAFGAGTTSMFGATSQPTTSFGTATAPGSAFSFGTQPQTTSLFGAKPATAFGAPTTSAPSFSFGQTQSSPFGAATSAGGIFAKPATSVAPFGASTTSTTGGGFGFGASTGAFGATSQQSGGLFGTTKPAFSGFGTAPQAGATGTGFGGFGSMGTTTFGAAKPGGMFGTTAPTTGTTFGSGTTFGTGSFGTGTGGLFGSTQTAQPAFGTPLQQQQPPPPTVLTLSTMTSPYGDSPILRQLDRRAAKREELVKPTSLAAQRAYAKPSGIKFRPSLEGVPDTGSRPLARRSLVVSPRQVSLFEGLESETRPMPVDVPMPSARRTIMSSLRGSTYRKQPLSELTTAMMNSPSSPPRRPLTEETAESPIVDASSPPPPRGSPGMTPVGVRRAPSAKVISNGTPDRDRREETFAAATPTSPAPDADVTTTRVEEGGSDRENSILENIHPAGIKCRRSGYYTIPGPEDLKKLVDGNGRCVVDGFTVGRTGFGSVYFPDTFDVSGLDIDEIVHIRRKEIVIYPDDKVKPPLDQGLNRPAEVTLDGCWPVSKAGEVIDTPKRLIDMRYAEILEKNCRKMGATFRDYRAETGSWVFEVRHFSKYGILGEDEDECFEIENQKKLSSKDPKQASGTVPFGSSVANASLPPQQAAAATAVDGASPWALQRGPRTDLEDGVEGASQKGLTRTYSRVPPAAAGDAEMDESDFPRGGDVFDGRPSVSRRMKPEAMSLFSPRAKALHGASHPMDLFPPSREEVFDLPDGGFFGDSREIFGGFEGFGDRDEEMPPSLLSRRPGAVFGERGPLLKMPTSLPASSRPDSAAATFPSSLSSPRGPSSGDEAAGAQLLLMGPSRGGVGGIFGRPLKLPQLEDDLVFWNSYPAVSCGPAAAEDVLPELKPQPPQGYLVEPVEASEANVMAARLRSVPICWGPRSVVVHCGMMAGGRRKARLPGFPFANIQFEAGNSGPGRVILEKTGAACETVPENLELVLTVHESCLRIELKHSVRDGSGGDFPRWAPVPGIDAVTDHAANHEALMKEFKVTRGGPLRLVEAKQIFDLLVALWTRDDTSEGSDPYASNLRRRAAVSRWLESLECVVKFDGKNAKDRSRKIFEDLIQNKARDARAHASEIGDSVIPQMLAAAVEDARENMINQLHKYRQNGYDGNVSDVHLMVYCLMAAIPIWRTSDKRLINPAEFLDWRRVFAIYCWYFTEFSLSVSEVLQAYEDSFRGTGPHGTISPYPAPTYSDAEDGPMDLAFHLLKLYVEKMFPLEPMVSPDCFTDDPLDFRMSWLMSEALESLNYKHLDPRVKAQVIRNYATQVEAVGLWEWAIFVLLHLEDDEMRSRCCRGVLDRCVGIPDRTTSLEEREDAGRRERFLVTELNVSPKLIASVKAVKARAAGRKEEEAHYLIEAGKWAEAHDLIVNHVAPDCVIRKTQDSEERANTILLLRRLDNPEAKAAISNWAGGGEIYLDYLTMTSAEWIKEREGKFDAAAYRRICSAIRSRRWESARDLFVRSSMCLGLGMNAFLQLNRATKAHPDAYVRAVFAAVSCQGGLRSSESFGVAVGAITPVEDRFPELVWRPEAERDEEDDGEETA